MFTTALMPDGRLFRLDPAGALSALALGAVADGTSDDAPAPQRLVHLVLRLVTTA